MAFDYSQAFCRTLGWVSETELQSIRKKHVAIGGTGGTGGYYALTMARLGIEHFTVSDFDNYELSNLNRQSGAFMHTLGKNKAETMAAMITGINPNIEVRVFSQGIDAGNVDSFLDGADLYLNAMGLSSADIQAAVFEGCRHRQIPGISAIVPGMGASLINFHPQGISFEQYFQVKGRPREEQAMRLLIGHNPRLMMRHYLLSTEIIRFKEYDGPVIPVSCVLAAGLACTEAVRILLNRRKTLWAPWSIQLDAYLRKFCTTWRPGGNRNILQRILLAYMRRRLKQPPVSP